MASHLETSSIELLGDAVELHIAISETGTTLSVGESFSADDGEIASYSLNELQHLAVVACGGISRFAISPDGEHVAAKTGGSILIWDTRRGTTVWQHTIPTAAGNHSADIAFLNECTLAAIFPKIAVWYSFDNAGLSVCHEERFGVHSAIHFAAQEGQLRLTLSDPSVVCDEPAKELPFRPLISNEACHRIEYRGNVLDFLASENGMWLAHHNRNIKKLSVYDSISLKCRSQIPIDAAVIQMHGLSHDGSRVLINLLRDNQYVIQLIDIDETSVVAEWHPPCVPTVQIARNHDLAVIVVNSRILMIDDFQIIHLKSGQVLGNGSGHVSTAPSEIKFAPNARFLVSAVSIRGHEFMFHPRAAGSVAVTDLAQVIEQL